MLQHANHLEAEYGAGPHTVSVPRMRPAEGSELSMDPPYPVDDANFKKLVAIIRIAVPYTGMILSTRCASPCRPPGGGAGARARSPGPLPRDGWRRLAQVRSRLHPPPHPHTRPPPPLTRQLAQPPPAGSRPG
jgi:hypothetical protein